MTEKWVKNHPPSPHRGMSRVSLPWSQWLAITPALLFTHTSSDFMEHSSASGAKQMLSCWRNSPQNHTESECSLLCLPEIAIGPFPEPDQSSPYRPVMFLKVHVNNFYLCTVHFEIYVVQSPTNALFINMVKSFKFTLKYTIISFIRVSIFNDHHQKALSVPD